MSPDPQLTGPEDTDAPRTAAAASTDVHPRTVTLTRLADEMNAYADAWAHAGEDGLRLANFLTDAAETIRAEATHLSPTAHPVDATLIEEGGEYLASMTPAPWHPGSGIRGSDAYDRTMRAVLSWPVLAAHLTSSPPADADEAAALPTQQQAADALLAEGVSLDEAKVRRGPRALLDAFSCGWRARSRVTPSDPSATL